MKKVLLGSSAIVAAAALVAPAQAADKIKLGVGGFAQYYIGDYQKSGQANGNQTVTMSNDIEIHFRGRTTLDNGLQVGFRGELEYAEAGAGDYFDEAVIYLGGGFGRLYVGEDDHAGFRTNIGNGGTGLGVGAINSPHKPITGAAHMGVGHFDTSAANGQLGDALNITYMSPRVNGFQVGATYVPDGSGADRHTLDDVGGQTNTELNTISDAIVLGASFRTKMNSLSLGFGAQYFTSTNDTGAAGSSDDLSSWALQTALGFGGFTLIGQYTERDNHVGGAGVGAANDLETQAWALNLIYRMGPWRLHGQYGEEEQETLGVTGSEKTGWSVGVTYSLGAGVALGLSYIDREERIANIDETGIFAGIGVSF